MPNTFFQLVCYFIPPFFSPKIVIKIPGVYGNRRRGVAQSLRALGCAVIYTAIWGRLSTCTCLASHKSRSLCCTPRCIPSLGDRDRRGQHQIKKQTCIKHSEPWNIHPLHLFWRADRVAPGIGVYWSLISSCACVRACPCWMSHNLKLPLVMPVTTRIRTTAVICIVMRGRLVFVLQDTKRVRRKRNCSGWFADVKDVSVLKSSFWRKQNKAHIRK